MTDAEKETFIEVFSSVSKGWDIWYVAEKYSNLSLQEAIRNHVRDLCGYLRISEAMGVPKVEGPVQ